ncbi:hypothetical protein TSOC_003832 [Tetrabaena socialis]|uniref:Uncharacterized protein n=1 Tax=Tetrabaena socialis TaxID=47790 RepID=A0A2J8AAN0_9CHLO|nr:hypothetical protein TSOC_003832 [Tetrabaena socialis]|eukprot:PNH09572.1 hypothetical protein TSOC_003832 [Tetrabaena socialis]
MTDEGRAELQGMDILVLVPMLGNGYIFASGASAYCSISFNRERDTWRAGIWVDGKSVYLGWRQPSPTMRPHAHALPRAGGARVLAAAEGGCGAGRAEAWVGAEHPSLSVEGGRMLCAPPAALNLGSGP